MPATVSGVSSRRETALTRVFTRDAAGSLTLARGLRLLHAFRVGVISLTNAELARRTQLPRPTVSRLTQSLVEAGFLDYDVDERSYRLSALFLSLSDAYQQAHPTSHVAQPLMRQLAEKQRLNAGLARPNDLDMVYLATERWGRDSVSQVRRVTAGTRVPMEQTATGLSHLASLNDAALDHLVPRLAQRSGVTEAAVRASVLRCTRQMARQGYCTAEFMPDHLFAVATTLVSADDQTYSLSISFSCERERVPAELRRHAMYLKKLKRDILAASARP
ncbi:helix-turn-helix domain-containing protein [Ottowia sp. GY511]|uniref:IclR family transcriptional regulator n=1 Tax=Ottowia flava TaxID=2675430 RepID=A0ABW4KW94_9BURK|nr:helix-turn-helix domain-containing protein [Ottowia sp. GY511]TXK24779.1 helix-turn-helix domain-containing protein [Ottowia sp. GY511]